jgi:predicted PurR-regulated permease PerM
MNFLLTIASNLPYNAMEQYNKITTENLMLLGAIIGGILSFFLLIIYLGDRLWKRPDQINVNSSELLENYTESIKTLINTHFVQLEKQNDNIKELITSFRTIAEDSKLRHEIIMNNLRNAEKSDENLHKKIDKIGDRFFYYNSKKNIKKDGEEF